MHSRSGTDEDARWLRVVESQRLASVMNETRWRMAVTALGQVPGYTLQFRVKSIDRDEPDSGPWTRGIEHAGHLRWVEWMDVNPKQELGALVARDFTAKIVEALQGAKARFSIEGDAVRIWGFLRPGCSPPFV